MVWPFGGREAVQRQAMSVGLQPLLQRRLPVLGERGIRGLVAAGGNERTEARRDELARRVDASVEVDRRDERLEAVGENGVFVTASRLFFSTPEQHVAAELDVLREARQRGGRDDAGLDLRLVSLVVRRKARKEHVRDGEPENRVA